MTPEERKAIAMRHHHGCSYAGDEYYYPNCCAYHEGFDAALALLEWCGEWIADSKLYAIEVTP